MQGDDRHLWTCVRVIVNQTSLKADTTQMPTDRCRDKLWRSLTAEYYLASQKDILTKATTWMNLEAIRLSEKRHTKEPTIYSATRESFLELSGSGRLKAEGQMLQVKGR